MMETKTIISRRHYDGPNIFVTIFSREMVAVLTSATLVVGWCILLKWSGLETPVASYKLERR